MMKKVLSLLIATVLLLSSVAIAEEKVSIDWSIRYSYGELEKQLASINQAYPSITSLYPIGHSWQERALWCMELTDPSVDKEEKTGIAVLANIHGGERESAACAMYFAWWLTENSSSEQVSDLLRRYDIYVVPVINPDGYEQSFVYNTRQNLRPVDANGDGVAFSDPYTDIDGDGFISVLYRGTADAQPDPQSAPVFGMESPDWDGNGIPGDDPRNSGIDMNRTFDYQWNRFDVDTVETGVVGANAYNRAGSSAATEPEVQAVQNFLLNNKIDALASLHTGIQSVLYPWCYRAYDEAADSENILYMKEVAQKMAEAFQATTDRGFYSKSSYEDYPTSAELIDFAYGRLNIDAYTIEVYNGGKSENGTLASCKWENNLPEASWTFYDQDALSAMGLDPSTLRSQDGQPLAENEGLWFYTSSRAKTVTGAPEDQQLMAEGCKDALLVMIESEPNGQGYTKPDYLNWAK